MNPQPEVLILLSTYNGERYLEQQIESIRAQTHRNWRLLVRDDGSSDSTCSLLQRYQQLDARIEIAETGRNLGPAESFLQLIRLGAHSGAEFLCLCDQDDIWVPHKLQIQLAALLQQLARTSPQIPTIVHSDFYLCDETGHDFPDSYFVRRFGDAVQRPAQLDELLFENPYLGCAMMFNRACALSAGKGEGEVAMHDWWLVLAALVDGGTLLTLPEPLFQYRQHSANVIGSLTMEGGGLRRKLKSAWRRIQRKRRYLPQIHSQLLRALRMQQQAGDVALPLQRYARYRAAPRWSVRRLAALASLSRYFEGGSRKPVYLALMLGYADR